MHARAETRGQASENLGMSEARTYSATYGRSAMNRARLTARVTACWLAAVQPLLRRLSNLPWRLVSFPSNSKSL